MTYEETQEKAQLLRKNIKETGLTFSLAAIFPVLASFLLLFLIMALGEEQKEANWVQFANFLLPQLCFALVAFLYFRRSKRSVKTVVKGCSSKYFLLAVLLQFGLLFSLSELNAYFIEFLKLFGYQGVQTTLPDISGWNFPVAILVIALLPALFEEVIFRGILAKNLNDCGWGTLSAALISGAMFSIFHGNPEQTVYQFICGVCFALVALRAGSILPTALAHFLNNGAILIFTACGYQSLTQIPFVTYLILCILSGICFVVTTVYLLWFDKNNDRKGGVKEGKTFFTASAIGLAICVFNWITLLITGVTGG